VANNGFSEASMEQLKSRSDEEIIDADIAQQRGKIKGEDIIC